MKNLFLKTSSRYKVQAVLEFHLPTARITSVSLRHHTWIILLFLSLIQLKEKKGGQEECPQFFVVLEFELRA
jgi:hypothetical protein